MAKTHQLRIIRLMAGCLALVGGAGAACAHSPYLRDLAPWTMPDGQSFEIGMLYGDGLFWRDPGRPVVLNSRQEVVALGPLVFDGYVTCSDKSHCAILVDRPLLAKWVPDPAGFKPPRPSDFYPESQQVEYGFQSVPSSMRDNVVGWTIPYRRNPLIAAAGTLVFFGLGFALVAALRNCLRPAGAAGQTMRRGAAIGILLGSIALSLLGSLLAAFLLDGGFRWPLVVGSYTVGAVVSLGLSLRGRFAII